MENSLSFIDFLMTPIWLAITYLLAHRLRKSFTNKETRPYFFKALHLKMAGAIMLGLIFNFYYGYGDTLLYHYLGGYAYTSFSENFDAFMHLTFYPIAEQDNVSMYYTAGNVFYLKKDYATYFVIRIVGLFSLFTFHSYMAIAIIFGFISFIGAWAMFGIFTDIYPRLHKKMAIAVFYLPSVFFWGSGLLKDSICFGALGLVFYGFYHAVIRRNNIVQHSILALFAMLILYKIKIYILLCFIPMLALWTYLQYIAFIKSNFLKFVFAPFVLTLTGFAGIYAVLILSQGSAYEIGSLATKTKINSTYLQQMSLQGSVYYLTEYDGTLAGLPYYFAEAVFVTLFRPFLWEARNPFALLSAIEATYFIWFTLTVFVKVKIRNFIKTFLKEPLVPASLFFTFAFAFAVGINSGNFGTLVRYKIHIMPFYIVALMIMLESNRRKTVSEQSLELLNLRNKESKNEVEQAITDPNQENTTAEITQVGNRKLKIPKKFITK